MAVLVDELKLAVKNAGRTVVYLSAYVFGKHRWVRIKYISRGPNLTDIPELEEEENLLIYDAMAGSKDELLIFCCEYLIFSCPQRW